MDSNPNRIISEEPSESFKYIGFWRRLGMGLIDQAIFFPVTVYLYFPIARFAFLQKSIIPIIVYHSFIYLYLALFTIKFGGTPGILALKGRINDKNGQNIAFQRFVIRELPYLLFILVTLSQLYLTVHGANQIPESMLELGKLTVKYAPLSQTTVFIYQMFGYLDLLVVLVNKHKRSIKDYIGGTLMIKK